MIKSDALQDSICSSMLTMILYTDAESLSYGVWLTLSEEEQAAQLIEWE